MELERVGGEAHAAVQRADHRPRLTAAHRQVLAHGEHAPALRVGERRVVDVLADVVLVHADRAVVRQRQVLRVDEVHGDRGVRRVLERDVPEPRGRPCGEHQREGDAEPCHSPVARSPAASSRSASGLRGPSSGVHASVGAEPPQIEVGRPALHLRSREQVEHDVAVLHAAERAVGVHLHDETGRALVAAGPGGPGCRHRVSSFIGVWVDVPPVVYPLK